MSSKEKKFDISYISVDSIQEGVGSSQIIPLVTALAKQGKKISLTTFEKFSPPESLSTQLSAAGIHWNILEYGGNGAFNGFFRLLKIVTSTPSANIIHARSDIPAVGAILSRSSRLILWDIRSLWADQRAIVNSKGWNFLTTWVARQLEAIAANHSSAISTLTYAVVPVLERRYRRLPSIREIIPTCVQTDKFILTPLPATKLTCLLSGTFNNFYDLERMALVISEIRKLTPLRVIWARPNESTSVVLGVGEDLIVTASYEEMPSIVSASHFGIAICKDINPETLTAVAPTKVAEFLASGRPMLVSQGIGDLDLLLEENRVGVSIRPSGDLVEDLLRFISLVRDKDVSTRCRKVAEENFSMETAIQKYVSIYDKMKESIKS